MSIPDRPRPGETGTRGPGLPRALAGVTVAVLCLSLVPSPASAAAGVVDPSTYVHAVCTTLGGLNSKLISLETANSVSGATTLTGLRDRLTAVLTPMVPAISSAVTDLRNAGAPNVKDGTKIAALVVKELTAVRDAFAKAARGARALSTSSPAAFKKGAQVIAKILTAAGAKANRVLDDATKRYKTNVLDPVRSQDPNCQRG
jgi:hypothetical protein